jgi:Ribbon-helix-helix domain
MEEAVRWNIKVSREIDLTLRTYLGARDVAAAFLQLHPLPNDAPAA